ncbi:T-cell leukemia/lymphoma protein 1A [Prionailurus iriomotensis]
MGELPFFRARTALYPDHLWIWERSVYVDENQRTWLPIIIEPLLGEDLLKHTAQTTNQSFSHNHSMESSLQVLMRQEDVLPGEAVCPGLLAPGLLPSMWQLYPERRYRGSDSSFWRIVYHIEISVARRRCSLSSCRTRSMSDEVTGIVDYHANCARDRLTQ